MAVAVAAGGLSLGARLTVCGTRAVAATAAAAEAAAAVGLKPCSGRERKLVRRDWAIRCRRIGLLSATEILCDLYD